MAEGKAIAGLIVNLFLPGLGSLIGGRTKTGIWQLVLLVLSWVLVFGGVFLLLLDSVLSLLIILGWVVSVGNWIWALVTGIQMLKE